MTSIFSGLPNDLIIKIVQIENDRRKDQKLTMERKYNKVIQELNKLSTIDIYCPSIRDMMDGPPPPGIVGRFGCGVAWLYEQELLFDANPNCW